MRSNAWLLIWLPIITLAISGCGQSINALDLQKAESATQTSQALQSSSLPLVPPSISDGEALFSQSCASCHTKDAEGEFKDISSGWLNDSTPKEAFRLLTNGDESKGMPAFADLSARERWDLIAYLFTNNFSESQKSSASLIYQNICLSCHGSEGQGDGSLALSRNLNMANWQMQPMLPGLSDQDIFSIIRNGKGSEMNAFAVMLSEPQTSDLTKLVRLLSLQQEMNFSLQIGSGQESGSEEDLLGQNQGYFVVEGNVINVSGGDVKVASQASLKVIANGQVIKKMDTTLLANGSFRFILVPYSPDWSYVVSVSHNGMTFNSNVIYGQDTASADTAHLLLQVYDSTTDISVLRGEQTHIMLEFAGDKTVRIVEYVMVSNHSSYVVVPQDSQTPLLQFTVPTAAQGLNLDNSTDTTYLKVMGNGFGDWQSIEPGNSHQVVFEYQLPFNGDDTLLFSFPVAATSVLVMVQDESNQITCKGPLHLNQRKMGEGTMDIFSAVNIAAGDELMMHCYNSSQLVPQIAAGVALLFVLVSVVLIFSSKKKQAQQLRAEQAQQRKNQILDAIIVLDDSYKAGDLAKDAYQKKRAELVKQLEEER